MKSGGGGGKDDAGNAFRRENLKSEYTAEPIDPDTKLRSIDN